MVDYFETKNFKLDLPESSGCSICLIGSTRSGKSYALSHMYNSFFKKNYVSVLMTNSPQADVYKELKGCIQSPQYIPRVIKDMASINKHTGNKYRFLAILDDLVTGIKFDKELIKGLCIHRNSDVSIIICSQAPTLLNTAGRSNINFCILMKLNSDEQIEKVVKWYLSSYFPSGTKMSEKINYYREATNDHFMFIVDNINGNVFRSKINVELE